MTANVCWVPLCDAARSTNPRETFCIAVFVFPVSFFDDDHFRSTTTVLHGVEHIPALRLLSWIRSSTCVCIINVMRGMSSATRRFRTSPPPLNRFPSVPAGCDDEYLKGYHIKRMRLRKRTLSKFVRLRLRKECIMPLIYISFTVLLVMNVSNNHLRSSS